MNLQNKRIIALCLAVLLLVPVLSFGVFAADAYIFELMPDVELYSDSIAFPSDGAYWFMYDGTVADGEYYIQATYPETDDGSVIMMRTVAPLVIAFSVEPVILDGVQFEVLQDGVQMTIVSAQVGYGIVEGAAVVQLVMDGVSFEPAEIFSYIELVPVESSGSALTDSVSDGLDNVIGWVGMVVISLLSGPLVPLLAIMAVPISVTVLVFSIEAIRRTTWGA